MGIKITQLERPIGNNLQFYKVIKETEKAYFLEPCQIYNTNHKKLWIPKCALITERSTDDQSLRIIKVKSWFLKKLSEQKILNWI